MNLRKTLFSAFAALALSAAITTPVAMAESADDVTDDNTAKASVTVEDNGVFNVYFASGDFTLNNVNLNSGNPSTSTSGTFTIGYTDSKAWRSAFHVNVQAGPFKLNGTSEELTIPATGFTIEHTDNIIQELCGGPGAVNCPTATPDYGDIGYRVNEAYQAQVPAGANWTANNTLDQSRYVHFGYEGVGTSSSHGDIDVELNIPEGTTPGQYQSQLTLTVTFGTP